MNYNLLISGVGGQGQVLASRLIGAAAIESGYMARTGETIGMAQRGGSVVSNVRIGENLLGPTIPTAQADLIIGFEICETARILPKMKPGATIILNELMINPVTVSLGMQSYNRDEMLEAIKMKAGKLIIIDATSLAAQAGSVKAVNVVMLGTALGSKSLPITRDAFISALKANLPEKYIDLNLKAFNLGYEFAREGNEQ